MTKHWRYHYPGEGKYGEYRSTLFLDERGAFAYIGDTGSGAYGHFSCDDIRYFVAYNLKDAPRYPSYLAEKLCKGRKTDFNEERTYKEAKRQLLFARRESPHRVDKELALDAWRSLQYLKDCSDPYEWREHLSDYTYNSIYGDEWYDFLEYDYDSWVLSFIKNSLPGLQELIRKELEEEACIKDQLVV